MKNSKGVTLVALVVTIVVLLILAGVSISMLSGDNGLITRARGANLGTIEGQVAEEIRMAISDAKLQAETNSLTSSTAWAAYALEKTSIANASDSDYVSYTILTDLKTPLTKYTGSETGTDAFVAGDNSNTKFIALEGYRYVVVTDTTTHTQTITIYYTTSAYKNACNDDKAYIKAVYSVSMNAFNLTSIEAYRDGSNATDLGN